MDNKHTFDNDISDLEIDVLRLYYDHSDQWGRVDCVSAANFAASKYGILIHQKTFQLSQQHLDSLMDRGVIYDTRSLFNKVITMPTPPKKKRRKRNDKGNTSV